MDGQQGPTRCQWWRYRLTAQNNGLRSLKSWFKLLIWCTIVATHSNRRAQTFSNVPPSFIRIMGFGTYNVRYYPGFVMNESKLFFEAAQSDLPRPKNNYCIHIDGMFLVKEYGLKLIREWNMPMEIHPVWVGDRKCMYAWLLPRNYGTTLFLDPEFQARLAKFKEAARIPGPPNEQPKWLALRDGDLPHTFVPGERWADEGFRRQSIQDTPLYLNSCANCDKSDPYVWEEGGAVGDDQEDEDEDEGEDVNSDSGEEDYSGREDDDEEEDEEEDVKIKQALE